MGQWVGKMMEYRCRFNHFKTNMAGVYIEIKYECGNKLGDSMASNFLPL